MNFENEFDGLLIEDYRFSHREKRFSIGGSLIRVLVWLGINLLRYSETLLRRESNGQITTNSNIHKSHSHSGSKPEVDRGRRPLVIATALCGVFFIAGEYFLNEVQN